MGSSDVYNLKWKDFSSKFSSSLSSSLENSEFIDVTLSTISESFSAHRLVLSSCSSYFKRILSSHPSKHPVIVFTDVSSEILKFLLRFMYHGAVDVPKHNLKDFLSTAQLLEIQGLSDGDANSEFLNSVRKQSVQSPKIAAPGSEISSSCEPRPTVKLESSPIPTFSTDAKSSLIPPPPLKRQKVTPNRNSDPFKADMEIKPIETIDLQSNPISPAISPCGMDTKLENHDTGIIPFGKSDFEVPEDDSETIEVEIDESDDELDPQLQPEHDLWYEQSPFAYNNFTESEFKSVSHKNVCPYCMKYFSRTGNVSRHIKEIHKISNGSHPCTLCEKSFAHLRHLRDHLKQKHGMFGPDNSQPVFLDANENSTS